MGWWTRTPQGWQIAVHAQPGAKRSAVVGLHGERLKVRIAAPPIDGRANDALVAFLAEALGVPRSRIRVVKGESSREKRVAIDDPAADVPTRLAPP